MLKLSNLDKLFWPEEGITKGDLLAYYRAVAPVLVPHLKNRPFTMKRYPDGGQGNHFFQKDAPKHMPDWIPTPRLGSTSRDRRGSARISSPLVNDELALLWMVNMGCIDMNTWYSRVDRPDRPDFVLFDLDPADDVGFARDGRGRAARQGVLDGLGLAASRRRAARTDARARADRAPVDLRGHARVRRDRRRALAASTGGWSRPSGEGPPCPSEGHTFAGVTPRLCGDSGVWSRRQALESVEDMFDTTQKHDALMFKNDSNGVCPLCPAKYFFVALNRVVVRLSPPYAFERDQIDRASLN